MMRSESRFIRKKKKKEECSEACWMLLKKKRRMFKCRSHNPLESISPIFSVKTGLLYRHVRVRLSSGLVRLPVYYVTLPVYQSQLLLMLWPFLPLPCKDD